MIVGNNIVATPLVITMVEATTVTTVMVKVMAADHLIGGTELTSDTKPWTDNIFCILFGKKKQPTICFSHSKIHCHKIKAIMQLSTQTAHYGLNRQFAVASTCGWEMFGYGGDPDNDCMLIWFMLLYDNNVIQLVDELWKFSVIKNLVDTCRLARYPQISYKITHLGSLLVSYFSKNITGQ